MSRIDFLIDKTGRLFKLLNPPPKVGKWLPTVFLNEDGQDVASCEETNARALRYATLRHIACKEYVGFDPNLDGVEV